MKTPEINFMGMRRIASVLSIAMIVIAIAAIAVRGLNLGLDFTGGTLLEVEYETPVALDSVLQY